MACVYIPVLSYLQLIFIVSAILWKSRNGCNYPCLVKLRHHVLAELARRWNREGAPSPGVSAGQPVLFPRKSTLYHMPFANTPSPTNHQLSSRSPLSGSGVSRSSFQCSPTSHPSHLFLSHFKNKTSESQEDHPPRHFLWSFFVGEHVIHIKILPSFVLP